MAGVTRAATGIGACAAVFFACSDPIGLPVEGARSFRPPAVFAEWWADTEQCSQLTGDFRSVRWYAVEGQSFTVHGQSFHGLYVPQSHSIILASAVREDSLIVRHEMLHALLRTPGHPVEYFVRRCGGIVHCAPFCPPE